MNLKIFKAYDIRGKYPSELNKEAVSAIAFSLGKYFGRKAKIIVARDIRKSSSILLGSVKKSLKKGGVNVIDVGLATTPMFYFLINKLKADGGIMLTASHNPKEYGGLKVARKKAMPISGKEILGMMNRELRTKNDE